MTVALDPEGTETRVIHEMIDFTGMDVLDIGCGDGRLTWRFAESAHAVRGIDPATAAIEKARAAVPDRLRARVTFQVADVTVAELPRSAFDVAVLSWSLC